MPLRRSGFENVLKRVSWSVNFETTIIAWLFPLDGSSRRFRLDQGHAHALGPEFHRKLDAVFCDSSPCDFLRYPITQVQHGIDTLS